MYKSMNLLLMGFLIFILFSIGTFAQASFQGLGFLPGATICRAEDISADGQVVVGFCDTRAFLWSAGSGMIDLGTLPGGNSAHALAVSADGQVVVGIAGGVEAFRWTQQTGMVELGSQSVQALGISDDGQIIVGVGRQTPTGPSEAFRWTQGEGFLWLGFLDGSILFSSATGISGDGNVIFGWSRSGSNSNPEAFSWNGSMIGLGFLPNYTRSLALDASIDGSVILGTSSSGTGPDARVCTWTGGNPPVDLGLLPGCTQVANVFAISADGSTVVGVCGSVAGIWDANGPRILKDVLENEYGLDLTGWDLWNASGISADGRAICGFGRDPNGQNQAWVVNLPDIVAWSNAQGGGFSNASNWVGGEVPDDSQVALFDVANYTSTKTGVSTSGNQLVTITFDQVTTTGGLNLHESQVIFDLQAHSYEINVLFVGAPVSTPDESQLEIINGALGINIGGSVVSIGAAGTKGQLIVSTGGIFEMNTDDPGGLFVVGANDDCGGGECGRLIIQNGGVVFTNASGRGTSVIGTRGGEGSVFISGNGSEWIDSSLVTVGDLGGIGLLDIQNPGVFGGKALWVAFGDSSQGTVRISGAGSLLELEGELLMGLGTGGEAHFTISNSATVFIKSKVTIAFGGEGDITVEGILSSLAVFDTTIIGKFGSGGLSVLSGGRMVDNAAVMPGR